MKKLLFLIILSSLVFAGFSQNRTVIPKKMQDFAVKYERQDNPSYNINQTKAPLKNTLLSWEEDIGMTYFDLQSIGSMQNRIHVFDDGTIGTVFNYGNDDYPQFYTRGTGYNYFNGSNWGDFPTEPLEDNRSGWPAYAPFGENGEIIVSHNSNSEVDGLTFSKRENKGLGEWEQWIFEGPVGFEDILWSRIATGGVNNSIIHLLAVTKPWPPYQGQEMALLYSRSNDGGINWSPQNMVFPEINANYYMGFSADTYDIRAQGENVAILIGNSKVDLLLLKSIDGGVNWDKTIIWEHPYPLWEFGYPPATDTFYCVDGSHNLDFDEDGIVHIVFGINRCYSDGTGTFWFPAVGGIGYWNENRPTFSSDLNALNPYGHPDSELIEDYSLIGWTQDLNGNDTIDVLDDWGIYYLGFSSMPQIVISETNRTHVVYSSVTEFYDDEVQNYRQLWRRSSYNGEEWGSFIHITSDYAHLFDECVFPSLSNYVDDFTAQIYLSYQRDNEPGMSVRGDEDPYGGNLITFMKTDINVGIFEDKTSSVNPEVSQNHPNPFNNKTTIQLKLAEPGIFNLEVTNLTGTKVYENNLGYRNSGTHNISIDVPFLQPGVYFYTVKADEESVTKKMVVK